MNTSYLAIVFKAHPENPEPEDLDFIYRIFPPTWVWVDQEKKRNGIRKEIFMGSEQHLEAMMEYIIPYFTSLEEQKRVVVLKKLVSIDE